MAKQFSEQENPRWRKVFFPIWGGQAISLVGSRLAGFALIWYLTESTGSAIVLSTVSLLGMLPEMILAPFAGALIDRWNRQKVMIIADSVIALISVVLGLLFAFDMVKIWHIYILMLARSIGGAFHYPAMSASTTMMVPRERYTNIQGLNQTLKGIISIVGAPLGALALAYMPISSVLYIDFFTALLAITPLFFIVIPQPEIITTEEQRANPLKTMWQDFVEGLRYVKKWKGLLIVLALGAGMNAIIYPAFNLLPLLVYETFGLEVADLALAQTIMGIGIIAGSVVLSIWGGFKKKMMTTSFGLLIGAIGLVLMAFAPIDGYWMLLVGIGMHSVSNSITNGPLNAIFQETIEPNMQGRFFSLTGTVFMLASPIGTIIAGPVSEWFGVQTWFLVGAIFVFFMCSVVLFSSAVRNLEEGNPHLVSSINPEQVPSE